MEKELSAAIQREAEHKSEMTKAVKREDDQRLHYSATIRKLQEELQEVKLARGESDAQ